MSKISSLSEFYLAEALYSTTPVAPWNTSRPIVCQNDMDRAGAARKMVAADVEKYRPNPKKYLEFQGALKILGQIEDRIAEREENSI